MLNYLYTILLAESSIALNIMGLDPALGFIHLDTPNRDSLACDLGEALRSEVDAFLFGLISRPLDRRWFFERGNGGCRLMPEICRTLSDTAPMWRSAVAPFAEWIAHTLAASSPTGIPLPATRLTRRNHRESKEHPKAPRMPIAPKVQSLCRICGVPVASKRQYCPSGAPVFQRELIEAAAKETGWKAAHTAKAEALRREAQKRHHAALAQWEGLPGWLTEEVYTNWFFKSFETRELIAQLHRSAKKATSRPVNRQKVGHIWEVIVLAAAEASKSLRCGGRRLRRPLL